MTVTCYNISERKTVWNKCLDTDVLLYRAYASYNEYSKTMVVWKKKEKKNIQNLLVGWSSCTGFILI